MFGFFRKTQAAQVDRHEVDHTYSLNSVLHIIQSMSKPAIALRFDETAISLNPIESRIGGQPAWPAGLDVPADQDGLPMIFIAQINLDDLPGDRVGMPSNLSSGLLQFFVQDCEQYGCQFPSVGTSLDPLDASTGSGFRIIHHKSVENLRTLSLTNSKADRTTLTRSNRITGMPVTFIETDVTPSISDFCVQKLLINLTSDEVDELYDAVEPTTSLAMAVGGYPDFTQEDPRSFGPPEHRLATFTLLKIGNGSAINIDAAERMHFLIDLDDLQKGDFSKALYNWDCS